MAETLLSAHEAEIKQACARIALDYSFYADHRQPDALGALFAADGEFHLFGQVHVGPAAVAKAMSGAGGAVTTVHALSNHRIDVLSENEARATAYVTVYVADPAAPAPAVISPFIVGIYHDTYHKTAAGWRFARRAFEGLITKAS